MDDIAEIIERLNNLVAALSLPIPANISVEALRESLPEVRDELKAAYLKLGGEDHWE